MLIPLDYSATWIRAYPRSQGEMEVRRANVLRAMSLVANSTLRIFQVPARTPAGGGAKCTP